MSESKSDALPLGDIPVSERRPLAGHTRYYTTAFPFWQSFFSVFYRRFPTKSRPDRRVIISRFSPGTLHSDSRRKAPTFRVLSLTDKKWAFLACRAGACYRRVLLINNRSTHFEVLRYTIRQIGICLIVRLEVISLFFLRIVSMRKSHTP